MSNEGVNKVILLGNLGADPELRVTAGGQSVLNLRVATTKSWFNKDKQSREERTDWHNVVIFGNRAEGLAKFLGKGRTIYVEGELRTSQYEKDGEKRYRTDVIASEIIPAGSDGGKQDGGGQSRSSGGGGGGGARKPASGRSSGRNAGGGFSDDDPYADA